MGPLIPLFWTSGDVCVKFERQHGCIACVVPPQIHCWCHTCWLLYYCQYGSWTFLFHELVHVPKHWWDSTSEVYVKLNIQVLFKKHIKYRKIPLKPLFRVSVKQKKTFSRKDKDSDGDPTALIVTWTWRIEERLVDVWLATSTTWQTPTPHVSLSLIHIFFSCPQGSISLIQIVHSPTGIIPAVQPDCRYTVVMI